MIAYEAKIALIAALHLKIVSVIIGVIIQGIIISHIRLNHSVYRYYFLECILNDMQMHDFLDSCYGIDVPYTNWNRIEEQ